MDKWPDAIGIAHFERAAGTNHGSPDLDCGPFAFSRLGPHHVAGKPRIVRKSRCARLAGSSRTREAARLSVRGHDNPRSNQYDLGRPSTCSAKKLRIKFVEIGAT
jgi:hypothetical protein